MASLATLHTVMKIQSIVFFAFGAVFLLVPEFGIETLFGYETDSFWPRGVGAAFLGIAWLEWNVADRLEERLDLVWPFALIPGLFMVVFLWERSEGTYPGTESFWWVNLIVSLVFFVAVIATRPKRAPESAQPETSTPSRDQS